MGFLLTPLFTFFLPKRERLDEVAYHRGRQVSPLRRGIATGIDLAFTFFCAFLIAKVCNHYGILAFRIRWGILYFILAYYLFFLIIPWLTKGKTIGKIFVHLQLINDKNHAPTFLQLWIRSSLFVIIYCILPPILMTGMIYIVYSQMILQTTIHPAIMIITFICGFIYIFQVISTIGSLFTSIIKPA